MKLDEFFRCVGGDYGEAKARFQNDERIVRFLNMFPGDDSMQNLRNAMNAGDTPTAFRAVHTLKGVALNLGLGSLAHASSQMTEALRGQNSLPESVPPLYVAVQKEHTAVCSALEQLEKQLRIRKSQNRTVSTFLFRFGTK